MAAKNELEIPKDGSVSIWPFQDSVVIAVFNKRGQRRFTIKLSPEQASAISEELKKTSSFVRLESTKIDALARHDLAMRKDFEG